MVLLYRCRLNFFVGSGRGGKGNSKVSLEIPITLVPGKNTIDLLSLTVGLQVLLHLNLCRHISCEKSLPESQKEICNVNFFYWMNFLYIF